MSKKTGKPRGRPRKPIDPNIVRGLAVIQCPIAEIAHVMQCSEHTLRRRFMPEIEAGYAQGRMSVRRMIHKEATDGANVNAAIWFSKQYMGQSDKGSVEMTGKDGAPLQGPQVHFYIPDNGRGSQSGGESDAVDRTAATGSGD